MLKHLARTALLCSFVVPLAFSQEPSAPAPQPSSTQERESPAEAKPVVSPKVSPDAPAANAAVAMQPVDPKTFMIGAEDVVLVQVWREPEFTRQVMVRPDGKITMPLIKEVQAGGKTPEQLGKDLEAALGDYLKTPEVTISVLQVNSRKYYVTGEVNRPGSFPLVVPTRVLDAITNAGGFREFANQKKIVVLRQGERLKFNYKEVTHGKKSEQNILLENGDYVIVP